jgi:thiamine biosynthesis lipoprotein
MMRHFSRRRFICIAAAAAGLELVPLRSGARAQTHLVTWRGVVLGAVATMQVHHPDRAVAERLVKASIREVRRLERIFSLYGDDSRLVALNRRGVLEAPPPELVELLGESRRHAAVTGGAFDPTVQSLWALYADHFSRPDADPGGPSARAIEAALGKVGFAKVLVSPDRIAFLRQGMMLSLNGIAQGYITDRVVALLRANGIDHSLVNMGESRALGARSDEQPWQVGIADPDQPNRIGETIPIVDRAVATSGGYGFRFDAQGRFSHLFDPKTGLSPNLYRSVTVIAPNATAADALSTAFSNMPPQDIEAALKIIGDARVHLTTARGERMMLDA